MSSVEQIAIIGNVSVGKTSLFSTLCKNSDHPVNIPGSTVQASRGVMAIGSGAASRSIRRSCSACKSGSKNGISLGWHKGKAPKRIHDFKNCPVAKAAESSGVGDDDRAVLTHLYDTPGSTSLAANGEDEMVARDLVLSGEMTGALVVADAKNLRRSLVLALEIAEFELPMVFSLNMLDEAEAMGIEVDDDLLRRELKVPVGRTVAVENRGVRSLAELLPKKAISPRRARFPKAVEEAITDLQKILENKIISTRGLAVLMLSKDNGARSWVKNHFGEDVLTKATARVLALENHFVTSLREVILAAYYAEAEQIVTRVMARSVTSPSLLVRFGHWAERPLSGFSIAILVLLTAYYFVGVFGATFVVDSLSAHLFEGVLLPYAESTVALIPSEFVRDAIMNPDFGLLPTGLFLALGMVLPVLFCFYLLQAILEDSGYLPRLAVLLDRLFRWLGLNGQSLIPLVLGFSCITMAVITTRMLPSRKERIIMTLLLVLGIPCAPLMAVMMVVLSEMPWTATAAIFGVIGTQILMGGYLASKLLPGELPDLILEIPQMRIPRLRIVLMKTWRRSWHFLKEALPVFLAASFVIFLFDRFGGLAMLENLFRPFVNGVLGLPDKFVQIFIKTAIRRENGATELMHLRADFDNVQLVVTMLVMTFLMPCINATIVIFKERGMKAALAILGTVVVWAIVVSAVFNWTCRTFGFTFS